MVDDQVACSAREHEAAVFSDHIARMKAVIFVLWVFGLGKGRAAAGCSRDPAREDPCKDSTRSTPE